MPITDFVDTSPPSQRQRSHQTRRNGAIQEGGPRRRDTDQPKGLLDLRNGKIAISTADPAPRDWTIDGLVLPGKSAVLGGFGGVSKTQLAIQLSIAIVLGIPFMEKAVKSGGAMLILGEEDRDEIARRVSAVVRFQKLTHEEIRRIEENMLAFPLVGQDTGLTAITNGALDVTAFARGIVHAAVTMGNVRLIVLDHLALFHGGDFNAREDAALTMRVVNHIAQETGASVLVLAHTPKSANQKDESDASMVSGSTAFVDQARGAWILSAMREQEAKKFNLSNEDRRQYVSLAIVKNNYGPSGDVYWFQRTSHDGVGLLEPVNLSVQALARIMQRFDGYGALGAALV
jgi:RecA-family ATPase